MTIRTEWRITDAYTAVGLAEGFITSRDEAEVLAAWQYLVDTGLVWRLQGTFGRTAARLIQNGDLLPAPQPLNVETLTQFLEEQAERGEMGDLWPDVYAGYAYNTFRVNPAIFANHLRETQAAHHTYENILGHKDDNWAEWYARKMLEGDNSAPDCTPTPAGNYSECEQ